MYRPDDWKNPHILNSPVESIMGSIREDACHHAYEAGADAMLKRLLEGVDTIRVGRYERIETPGMSVYGTWVFIPEE